jgi:hypothetical protein
MNAYLIRFKDGMIAVKFSEPPKEIVQLGARVYICSPGLSIGYLEYWAEMDYKEDKNITEINIT